METKFRFIRFLVVFLAVSAVGALPAWPDHAAETKSSQARPIALGTSGGNIHDISSLYCCSGTLGALVESEGLLFILSNNHVLARSNGAALGEPVSQPGMIDQGCQQSGLVADLADFVPLQFKKGRGGSGPTNEVDAAIALVRPGEVREDGSILGIGPVSGTTAPASLNQAVQKTGRTTGHTSGAVSAVDVTVDVAYSNSCGGPANQLARFVNQIRITPGSFSAGGDSGSLIVELGAGDPIDGNPRAVGLLFAGSTTSTLANPIDSVLASLGVTLVGGTPAEPPATGSVSGVVVSAADGSAIEGAAVSVDTGQSGTTGPDGGYSIANVPVGGRSVTASASGFESGSQEVTVDEDTVRTADFVLVEAEEEEHEQGTLAIAQCVVYDTSGGKSQDRHLTVQVQVRNDGGAAVAGAGVSISLTLDGALFGTGSGTTGSNGSITFTANNAPNGSYATAVTNIVAPGLTFEGSTPANAFTKGVEAAPASFCRDSGSETDGSVSRGGKAISLDHARSVNARNSDRFFAVRGVVGHGVGLGNGGGPVIEVYLEHESASARAGLPDHIENVPVRPLVTGPFEAY